MSDAGKRGEGKAPPDSAWHTFALEWSRYADSLSSSPGGSSSSPSTGGDLTEEQVKAMSPEQRESLAALARAAASASGAMLSNPDKEEEK
jgi:hypothetical protein